MNMVVATIDKVCRMVADVWFNTLATIQLAKRWDYKGSELDALMEITGWETKNYGINLINEYIDMLDGELAELEGYPEWTKTELLRQRASNQYLLTVLRGEN